MTMVKLIYSELSKEYSIKYLNILFKQITGLLNNNDTYRVFISNNYCIKKLLTIDCKVKSTFAIMVKMAEFIECTMFKCNISNKVLFLYSILSYVQKINVCECYIPIQIAEHTCNKIVSYVKEDLKDLNLNNIKIIRIHISKFKIYNLVYILVQNTLIRYSISNFLITIIKKELFSKDAKEEYIC